MCVLNRLSKQGCEDRAQLSFVIHGRVLEGEQALRHPKARPKRWQPPAHSPSARCSRKALTRQRTEALCPGGKRHHQLGRHGPPSRVPQGTGGDSRCHPGRRIPSGAGSRTRPGRGIRGHRQVMAERRGLCVSKGLPPASAGTGTHLPSAGD